MSKPAATLLSLLAILSASIGAADAAPDDPSTVILSDPAGDVDYRPEYVGPRDRDFLDLETARVSYDNQTDKVRFALQVYDTTALNSLGPTRRAYCTTFIATYQSGQPTGSLRFLWEAPDPDAGLMSEIRWLGTNPQGPAALPNETASYLRHGFSVDPGAHGFFAFEVDRHALLLVADEFTQVSTRCCEFSAPTYPLVLAYDCDVFDEAIGHQTVSLASFRPHDTAVPLEPWERSDWVAPAIGIAVVVKLLVGWWLYARLSKERILGHPVRARLIAVVEQNPGIRHRELGRATGLAPGALAYHLDRLQRTGFVFKQQLYGFSAYFVRGISAAKMVALVAGRAKTAEWILAEVRRNPGLTAQELASLKKLHPSSILFHVRRLVAAGILQRTRSRRGLELRIAGDPASRGAADIGASSASVASS